MTFLCWIVWTNTKKYYFKKHNNTNRLKKKYHKLPILVREAWATAWIQHRRSNPRVDQMQTALAIQRRSTQINSRESIYQRRRVIQLRSSLCKNFTRKATKRSKRWWRWWKCELSDETLDDELTFLFQPSLRWATATKLSRIARINKTTLIVHKRFFKKTNNNS